MEEKVDFVLWLVKLKFTVAVQRKFRAEYCEESLHRNSIGCWMKKFQKAGSVRVRQFFIDGLEEVNYFLGLSVHQT